LIDATEKTTQNRDGRSSGQDLNRELPQYEAISSGHSTMTIGDLTKEGSLTSRQVFQPHFALFKKTDNSHFHYLMDASTTE
jgi:hypothetical protein